MVRLPKISQGMWSMVDSHLRKLLWVYCPGHARVKGNDRADRLVGKATLTRGLLLGRSEVLRSLRHYRRRKAKDITPSIAWRREAETLPVGTKPRTSHHRSPGGERQKHYQWAQNQGHHTIDRLEERGRNTTSGHKAKDITPSIAWRREAETLPVGTKPRTSHHRSPGGERQRHYQWAQSQGHHTIDRLEERGIERGSARRSCLKERQRAIVN